MQPHEFKGAVQSAIADWQTSFSSPAAGIEVGAVPVFFENGPQPDESTVGPIWVDVAFRFYSGRLSELGSDTNRHTGVIAVGVYTKTGEGTAGAEAVIRSLTGTLCRKRWGSSGVTLGHERMTPPPDYFGWHRSGAMVSFYFNETR